MASVEEEQQNQGTAGSSQKEQQPVNADALSHQSLFEETFEMTQRAFFIYCLADMRALAKDGKLIDGDCMLQLPVTLRNFSHVMRTNYELLKTEYPEGYELYGPWLENFLKKMEKEGAKDLNKIYFVEFDDMNSQGEFVYFVGVDHYRKKIVAVFCGSVTIRDWVANAKVDLVPFPNPARNLTEPNHDLSNRILLHHGFAEYLYGYENEHSLRKTIHKQVSTSLRSKNRSESSVSTEEKGGGKIASGSRHKKKCEELMGCIRGLFAENPTYRVSVSGHSLGAALASLVALEAACAEGIPKPVTCVAVASPKVGNVFFRQTVEYLEASRRLRFLRVSNSADVVTLLPDQGCCYPFSPERSYHHVGMKIKLYPHNEASRRKPVRVTYPRGRFGDNDLTVRFLQAAHYCSCCFMALIAIPLVCLCPCLAGGGVVKFHSCAEYTDRLQGSRSHLDQVLLDECYNREVKADLYPKVESTPESNEFDDPSYSA